jgi:hypothetical protein
LLFFTFSLFFHYFMLFLCYFSLFYAIFMLFFAIFSLFYAFSLFFPIIFPREITRPDPRLLYILRYRQWQWRLATSAVRGLGGAAGCACGSGWVAVVPLDSWDQCGHFGIWYIVWLWLGWQWRGVNMDSGSGSGWVAVEGVEMDCGCACGSGWVAVVSLDSWDQCGHFDMSYIVWLWLGWQWRV